MPFKTILKELMDSSRTVTGAILADWEGEAVEQCSTYDIYDIKVIGAHNSILLNTMKALHQKLSVGEMKHAVISTEKQHFLIGPIGPDYLLVMTVDKNAIVAIAIKQFNSAIERMYKEIY